MCRWARPALQAVERYVRRWGVTDGASGGAGRGRLPASGVLQVVRRLCRRAGVEDRGCMPSDALPLLR